MKELEQLIRITQTKVYESLSDEAKQEISSKKKNLMVQVITETLKPFLEKWGEDLSFSLTYRSGSNEIVVEQTEENNKTLITNETSESNFGSLSAPNQESEKPDNDSIQEANVVAGQRRRGRLRITLPDGRIIQEKTASETFSSAVKEAGFERVRAMDFKVAKVPIVSDTKSKKSAYASSQHEIAPGIFVFTNLQNEVKKDFLEQINERYQLGWKVEIL